MPDDLLRVHRTEILQLAEQHGARNVRVFGSHARDEATEESDLDLLVALDEGTTLLDVIALKHHLEDLTHRPVDLVSERALSPYLRDRVLADAIPL